MALRQEAHQGFRDACPIALAGAHFLLHDPQLAAVAEGPAKALAAGGLGGGWRAVGGGRWTVGGGRWAVGGEGVALLRGAALCWNFESRFLEAML